MRRILAVTVLCGFMLTAGLSAGSETSLPGGPGISDIDQAWEHHLRSDDAAAERLALKAVEKEPGSYSAHELLYILSRLKGSYGEMFPHLLAMLDQDRMENALYLTDLMYLNPAEDEAIEFSKEDKEILDTKITQKLRDAKALDPELAFVLRKLQGYLALERGDIAPAKKIFESLGYIRDWLVIGSFDNKEDIGFDEAYPPEKEIDPGREYDGIRWKTKWRKLKYLSFTGKVDLFNVLQPNEWAVGYAATFVHSPVEGPAELRIGADDGLKAWFNDALVLSDNKGKVCTEDQYAAGITLKKGWNKLLVKVTQFDGSWQFRARIVDISGAPVPGLSYALDPAVYHASSSPAAASLSAAGGMESIFARAVQNNPQDERARYFLARWLLTRDLRDKAIGEYEKLLALNPRCSRYYLDAAQVYANNGLPTKSLMALNKAAELAPLSFEVHYRLGKYYFAAGLNKKAENEFKQCVEINPQCFRGYLSLSQLSERENRLDEAFQYAEEAFRRAPFSADVLRILGAHNESKGFIREAEQKYREAIAADYGNYGNWVRLIGIHRKLGKYDLAVKDFTQVQQVYTAYWDRLNLADCYMNDKKYGDAIQACKKALDISPDNFEVYTKLGMIQYILGNKDEAKKHWETALALKPDYQWLRDYMKSQFVRENALFERYALTGEDRKNLLAHSPDIHLFPHADAIMLFDQGIAQVFADGSSAEFYHIIVKIANGSGRDRFGRMQLPNYGTLKILKAVTIRPSGEEVEPTSVAQGNITFASVDVGSLIEVKYTVDKSGFEKSWLKGNYDAFWRFQEMGVPTLRSQFVLALPKDKEFRTLLQGDTITSAESVEGDTKIKVWEGRDLDQIYPEENQPPFYDISSFLGVTTITSWDYLSKWESSLIKDQLERDASLKAKVKELTNGKKNLEDKIRALYNYVTMEIRYENARNEGIFGVKPQKAVNVFTDGFGVCKDKAILLVSMLQEIGVKAKYVLVKTADQGKTFTTLPFPWFNHAIVYIEPHAGQSEGKFVDATSKYLGYGDLWGMDQGVDTFVCQPDTCAFIATPVMPPGSNKTDLQVRVAIDENGTALGSGSYSYTGVGAAELRYRYANEGQRKDLFEETLSGLVPGVTVSSCTFSDIENIDTPVAVAYRFSAPYFASISGATMFFRPLSSIPGKAERFARKSTRRYDVRFDTAWEVNEHQEFALPRGYAAGELPESVRFESPWMDYTVRYRSEDKRIICDRKCIMKAIRIKKDDYEKFRVFCVKIDSYENRGIMLERRKDVADTTVVHSPVKPGGAKGIPERK